VKSLAVWQERPRRREKGKVIFLGPRGVGKTHLVVSLALKACQTGMSMYFTNMANLILKLRKDYEAGNPGKGRGYYKFALVVVEEVGYTLITREECNLFFRFVANRFENFNTNIISNKAFGDWTGSMIPLSSPQSLTGYCIIAPL
jgi:DNA replication protein DnaC